MNNEMTEAEQKALKDYLSRNAGLDTSEEIIGIVTGLMSKVAELDPNLNTTGRNVIKYMTKTSSAVVSLFVSYEKEGDLTKAIVRTSVGIVVGEVTGATVSIALTTVLTGVLTTASAPVVIAVTVAIGTASVVAGVIASNSAAETVDELYSYSKYLIQGTSDNIEDQRVDLWGSYGKEIKIIGSDIFINTGDSLNNDALVDTVSKTMSGGSLTISSSNSDRPIIDFHDDGESYTATYANGDQSAYNAQTNTTKYIEYDGTISDTPPIKKIEEYNITQHGASLNKVIILDAGSTISHIAAQTKYSTNDLLKFNNISQEEARSLPAGYEVKIPSNKLSSVEGAYGDIDIYEDSNGTKIYIVPNGVGGFNSYDKNGDLGEKFISSLTSNISEVEVAVTNTIIDNSKLDLNIHTNDPLYQQSGGLLIGGAGWEATLPDKIVNGDVFFNVEASKIVSINTKLFLKT